MVDFGSVVVYQCSISNEMDPLGILKHLLFYVFPYLSEISDLSTYYLDRGTDQQVLEAPGRLQASAHPGEVLGRGYHRRRP